MTFNFPLLLVVITLVTGVIWLIDSLFFASKRRRRWQETEALAGERSTPNAEPYEPVLVEYARSFFPVLALVLILRSFIFEPFRIPSGSMIPTLLVGDFILVNKFSYGLRLPVLHNRIVDTGSPQRGDVAVFRFPENPSLDYIKRVIGLPGDTVVYRDKQLFVNGETFDVSAGEPYLDPYTGKSNPQLTEHTENFGESEHQILRYGLSGNRTEQTWVVPENHYFMMGDNRDNSNDGRAWGFVPEENLVGKAVLIWMNIRNWSVQWNRIGDRIK